MKVLKLLILLFGLFLSSSALADRIGDIIEDEYRMLQIQILFNDFYRKFGINEIPYDKHIIELEVKKINKIMQISNAEKAKLSEDNKKNFETRHVKKNGELIYIVFLLNDKKQKKRFLLKSVHIKTLENRLHLEIYAENLGKKGALFGQKLPSIRHRSD